MDAPTDLDAPPPTPATESTESGPGEKKTGRTAVLMAVAVVLALAIGVGVAMRDTTTDEEPRTEASEPADPEPPEDPSVPPEEPELDEEEPVATMTMVSTPVPPTMAAEPDDEGDSRSRMRRRSTPAERAGLELDPYGN